MASPRRLTIKAIDEFKGRVTVGDVSSHSGLAIEDARQELIGLAEAAGGVLQVSDRGEIAYVFQPDYLEELDRRQRRSRFLEIRTKVWRSFLYLLELSFGVILLVSIAIAIAVIALLIIANQSREQGRGGGRSRRSSRGSGGPMLVYMPNLWVGNPFFTRTSRNRRRYSQPRPQSLPPARDRSETAKLNFLEAVYSFLFGEGDPNPELEARSQQAIAQRISANRGQSTRACHNSSPQFDSV